jgi:hypothetical protein
VDEQHRNYHFVEPSADHPVRVLEDAPQPQWPQVR